jgi:hypothetical protein
MMLEIISRSLRRGSPQFRRLIRWLLLHLEAALILSTRTRSRLIVYSLPCAEKIATHLSTKRMVVYLIIWSDEMLRKPRLRPIVAAMRLIPVVLLV